jgi:hypothetical protein
MALNRIISKHTSGKFNCQGIHSQLKSCYIFCNKQVSNHLLDDMWGGATPSVVKAEADVEDKIIIIRQLWTALLRKFSLGTSNVVHG